MDKMNRNILLIFISIFLFGSLHAQVPFYPKRDKVSFTYTTTPNNQLYVRGNGVPAACFSPRMGSQLRKATLHALLDWKSDELMNGAATEYRVALNIQGYSNFTGGTLLATYTHTLTVKSNKPQSYVAIDFTGLHSTVERFEVTATYSLLTAPSNAAVESVIQTDVYFTEEYDYGTNSLGSPVLVCDPVVFNGNEATFRWRHHCPPSAPNYQFQLLRLFNNDIATSSSETDITALLDWDKALTIETGNSLNEISLTLAEGTGYYIWRVRPIGNAFEGGLGNDLNWGVWSTTGSYTSSTTNYVISTGATPYLFFYNQFDDGMNWIFSRSFIEGDKQTNGQIVIGESMNYANGLQMALQQQSRLKAEQKKMVGETIYDYSGRPALTAMAAPVNDNTLGYISGYVKNALGNTYSAADFDANGNYKDPLPVDINTPGPGKYYSDNNDLESDVPSAGGYPYSRTLFMNDGTSQPKEQSSPGTDHTLTTTAPKHTIRNFSSSVADIELISIFGDEAPDANSVLKNITTDANNGSFISYVSKEGQTIASCLSNPGAPNLDPLTPAAIPVTVDSYLNNNTSYGSGGLSAFKTIVLTEPTSVSISYSITPNVYEDNCVEFCATCDYKVTIRVIDNDDPSGPMPVPEYTTTVNPTSGTGGCSASPTNYSTTVMLPKGSYTVERIIEAYQINPSATPPAGTLPNTPFLDQFVKQVENAMLADFNSGTAVIVDDFGVPVSGAPSINMATLRAFLPSAPAIPDLDALYAYLDVAPEQDHVNLQIGCHIVRLPILRCASDECPIDNDFEKYFTDWYSGHYGTTTTITTLMPQYSAGEFNTVIANMISCGGYDCQALYSCWRSIVSSYESINNMSGTDLSASDNGYSMPLGTTYTPNYLDMFLDCAGYKLVGINNNPGGSGCSSPGYKFHPYAYFQYTSANRCTNCESVFYLQAPTVPPNPLATPTHNSGSTPYTWTSDTNFTLDFNTSGANYEQMKLFFDCIQLCNTTGTTPTFTDFANDVIDDCIEACEERYSGFVNSLIGEYHRNNVHVEGDLYQLAFYAPYNYYIFNTASYTYNPATDISMATIYCQAQALVEACKTQCALTVSTVSGQTTVGTPAEIVAMANAMYGVYDLEIPSGPGCSPGYSSTAWGVPGTAFVQYVANVLNDKLTELRATAPVNGFYWNYKSFLVANVSTNFNNYKCDFGNFVFIHPDIPSYFDFEPSPPSSCNALVYYFNKQQPGSPLTAKRLYSTSLISPASPFPSEGFNYVSTISKTGALAMTEQVTSAEYSYIIDPWFSPRAASALAMAGMDLTSVYNAGTITNTTSLYGYKLSGGTDNGFYKTTLCTEVCSPAVNCSTICYKINPAPTMAVDSPQFEEQGIMFTSISCEQAVASQIMNALNFQMGVAVNAELDKIRNEYRQKCINELVDETKISYSLNYHHFTLYYYDRAGNLVKTVPPKGVVTGTASRMVHPAHTYITEYAYNSLHELVRQKTPDGGETKFWYDKIARLRFSQNAKQVVNTKMSFTKYDALGRVKESGEMPQTFSTTDLENMAYPVTGVPSSTCTDITVINYSSPPTPAVNYFGGKTQRYLQNRVSYGYSDKDGKDATPGDRVLTYYSYDPHGNVEWLIQDIPEIGKNYIAYEYDLISGSVLKVKYNEEFPDKFFHRYTYDESKRLKTVETSKDEVMWEKDAKYTYYLHGPLKRAEIGHDKIQGLDYTYTIMGWLKSLNHIDNGYDPGKDGNEAGSNAYTAKDAFSMQLGYYEGDYISKSSRSNSETSNPYYLAANSGRDLYNGNISTWTTNYDYSSIPANTLQHQTTVNGRVFNYDELNRITKSDYKTQDPVTKLWAATTDYNERFAYDANGNITSVKRKGFAANPGGLDMDDFTYNPVITPGGSNQLSYVSDLAPGSAYTTDIDDQTTAPTPPALPAGVVNYMYDKIGNLIGDWAGGIPYDPIGGTGIYWNPQGKVSKIVKKDNTVLEFLYDMMGRRVYKKAYKTTDPITAATHRTTYYVVDASGNSMAIYTRSNSNTPPPTLPNTHYARFDLSEQPIYGSDRIGERSLTGEIYRDIPFISGNQPTGQGLPATVHISSWPQIMIPLANTTAKQIYNKPMNLNSGTNTATDLGSNTNISSESGSGVITIAHGRNQALLHDSYGNLLLTAYTYIKSTSLIVPRIYALGNAPIANSNLINSSENCQSVFIKRPGSEDEYFYVTIGTDNKPYFHTIDLSALSMINYNNLIDNSATYGPAMAVIDDRVGTPTLYLTSYISGTTSVKVFTITQDGFVPSATTGTISPSVAGAVSEMQISANGLKIAFAHNLTSSTAEVRMFSISADHQTLGSLGKLSFGASTFARSVEFTQNDTYIYFTHQSGTTTKVYRQLVSSFSGPAVTLALPGTAVQTITGTNTVGAIRRGTSNNLYYLSNTTAAPTTSNIYMISGAEVATPTVSAANAIATTVTNGSLPTKSHVIDYQLPTTTPAVYARSLDKKEYELKDHLGNVHSTISDYKLRVADPNVRAKKNFDNNTTEGFTAAGGGTIANVNNQMSVTSTLGAAATISFIPAALPIGKYVLSFDYMNGNTALASYALVQGTALQLKGYMSSSGRQSVAFEVPAVGTTTLTFTCEDPLTNRIFYIDNVLIKQVTTTIADPVVTMNDNFSSGGNGWIPASNTDFTANNMQIVRTGTVTAVSVSKEIPLIPGQLYKVNFDVNAAALLGSTLNFEYSDNDNMQADYSYFVRNTNGTGNYTYYFVPRTPSGDISFAVSGIGAGTFSLTVDNIVVTQYENNSLPLYTAKVNSLTDYYAFGAQMPGRNYVAANSYRYGFGGKEKDNEVYGEGNEYDFGARIYDPRLGKWLACDPLASEYPQLSPYQYCANSPLIFKDPDGKRILPTDNYSWWETQQAIITLVPSPAVYTYLISNLGANANVNAIQFNNMLNQTYTDANGATQTLTDQQRTDALNFFAAINSQRDILVQGVSFNPNVTPQDPSVNNQYIENYGTYPVTEPEPFTSQEVQLSLTEGERGLLNWAFSRNIEDIYVPYAYQGTSTSPGVEYQSSGDIYGNSTKKSFPVGRSTLYRTDAQNGKGNSDIVTFSVPRNWNPQITFWIPMIGVGNVPISIFTNPTVPDNSQGNRTQVYGELSNRLGTATTAQ
ncbi:MAG: hypothetical protein K0S33_1324 [Bacteroidetes bacterium]|jgi:RHS repeat-associated protein|nr:hypothetical protein [Bacteroidota bacterium]